VVLARAVTIVAFASGAAVAAIACGSDDSTVTTATDGGADSSVAVDGSADDAAIDATTQDAAPPEAGVRFVGRFDVVDGGGTRFEWPGVSLNARFTGTSVGVDLDDTGNSELAVFVDGTEHSKIVASAGRKTYALASGLDAGTHELLVWRRSEAFVGRSEFFALTFADGGTLLSPPAPLARRIEIIGDSLTCGYGNEGMPGCHFTSGTENNYLAYGSVAARLVNAELSTVAWSGLGMYRNYGDVDASAKPLPFYYDDSLPTIGVRWDFSKFIPDVVVINLGSNDSSTHGDPGQPYIDAYVAFVKRVRAKYPNAFIMCIDSNSIVTNDVSAVVTAIKGGGDMKIESFAITGQNGQGCDGHPNIASDQAMGESLAGELRRVMGW
jgi:lysophospholipase L1-like esterase